MTRWGRCLAVLGALAGASASSRAVEAQVPLIHADLRLPSDGAGIGTLAVRLTYPGEVATYRYGDGAPVAIVLPGGFGVGSLGAGQRIAEQGFVVITFVFPGGVTPLGASDGVYDYRGDNCQRALRDVIRFAEGSAVDSLGRTLDDIVPGPVHPAIVGLAPYSNGLIGLITLDRYGAEIPYAPYQAGWENPTSAQVVNGDLGANGDDCDDEVDTDGNGLPGDDAKNPWYDPATGYGAQSFVVDYTALRWDPAFPVTYSDPSGRSPPASRAGALFLDGRPNGRVDFRPGVFGCLDYDGDGILERTEDYRFRAVTTFNASCAPEVYFSPEVTREAHDREVFGAEWPSWIAGTVKAEAWWPLRDATMRWAGIAGHFPRFRGMTVYTEQDHVQSQDDHPHIRQVMDGMSSQRFWYRLNADAVYFREVGGSLPADYVETPAGSAVPLGEMKLRAEPMGTRSDDMEAAGHAEMADRIHSGCWWPDLGTTLRSPVPPEPEVLSLHVEPDKQTITWIPVAGAYCHDVLRGDLAQLTDEGGQVLLAGAACVEEDSADAASVDLETPEPGRGFYYVAKPGGLHGTYGTGSNGHGRVDVDAACSD